MVLGSSGSMGSVLMRSPLSKRSGGSSMNDYVVALFAALAGFFILAAWLAIWSRRATPARHVSMGVLLLGLAAIAVVAVGAMGFPKPLAWAWQMNGEARVIGLKLVQDEIGRA